MTSKCQSMFLVFIPGSRNGELLSSKIKKYEETGSSIACSYLLSRLYFLKDIILCFFQEKLFPTISLYWKKYQEYVRNNWSITSRKPQSCVHNRRAMNTQFAVGVLLHEAWNLSRSVSASVNNLSYVVQDVTKCVK